MRRIVLLCLVAFSVLSFFVSGFTQSVKPVETQDLLHTQRLKLQKIQRIEQWAGGMRDVSISALIQAQIAICPGKSMRVIPVSFFASRLIDLLTTKAILRERFLRKVLLSVRLLD